MIMSECTRVGAPPQIFLISFAQIPRVALETSEGYYPKNLPWPRPDGGQ